MELVLCHSSGQEELTYHILQLFLLEFIPEFLNFGISKPLISIIIKIRNLTIYSNKIRDELHQELSLLERKVHFDLINELNFSSRNPDHSTTIAHFGPGAHSSCHFYNWHTDYRDSDNCLRLIYKSNTLSGSGVIS
mgnify:CR=1 FL=1